MFTRDERVYSVSHSGTKESDAHHVENESIESKTETGKTISTTADGEEDESENNNNRFECCNPFDYIDINTTKYYDLLVIVSSFANVALSIIVIINFYHNKEWVYFGVSLSLLVFSHICYAIGFRCI